MAKKLNRFFKNSYESGKFEKKILGRVFLKDERELLLSVYEKKDDRYSLMEITDPDSVKKLNKLVSTIKKNSGALGIGKLGALFVVVIFFTIFTIFFQNPLAEKGIEKGLEKIFGAEAEVTGLRLSIFRGFIRYRSMEVADSGDLERNLFQTGEAVIDLDMSEILKGKFAASEIKMEDFALGEKRAKKAKPLASAPESVSASETKRDGEKPAAPLSALLPENLTPDRETVKKVLQENMGKLTSPAAAEEAAAALKTSAARLEEQTGKLKTETDNLKNEVSKITSTKLSSKLDIAGAKKLADRIKSASAAASSISSGIESAKKEASLLEKGVSEGKKGIDNAIASDVEYIASFFPGGGAFSVSSIAESAAREKLEPIMEKYGKAYDIVLKIKESGKKSDKKADSVKARRGRDIRYTVYGSPSFHIKRIYGSLLTGGSRHSIEILDVTNDQDVLGRPLVFMIDSVLGDIKYNAEGSFDTRESAENFSDVSFSATGGKFSDAPFLVPAGIDKFSSSIDIKAESTVSSARDFSGTAGIVLKGMELNAAAPAGRIIKGIIEKEERIDLELKYKYTGNNLSLKVKSSLDSMIAKLLSPGNIAAEVKGFAKEELAGLLKEKIALQDGAVKQAGELKAKITQLDSTLKTQKEQLDAKLKTLPKI